MSLVFKVGDTVYHYVLGQGTVSVIDDLHTNSPYHISYTSGSYHWEEEKTLSFTPWPAPNHTRPIQNGLYIVRKEQYTETYLAFYKDKEWFWVNGPSWPHFTTIKDQHLIKIVKFLSETPE